MEPLLNTLPPKPAQRGPYVTCALWNLKVIFPHVSCLLRERIHTRTCWYGRHVTAKLEASTLIDWLITQGADLGRSPEARWRRTGVGGVGGVSLMTVWCCSLTCLLACYIKQAGWGAAGGPRTCENKYMTCDDGDLVQAPWRSEWVPVTKSSVSLELLKQHLKEACEHFFNSENRTPESHLF